MVSFTGSEINDENYKHFKENGFSNFMFFSHNLTTYDKVAKLCVDLQRIAYDNAKIPGFISIDQEGGMVSRLFSGATHFPSAMAVGASGIEDVAFKMGRMVGSELRNLGINFNLAPVLDVNTNPDNPVIGVRSFSENPSKVAEMGVSYIKGLQESRVIATGKHFPGHGNTHIDSHLGLPEVTSSREKLEHTELVPFLKAIESGVMAIMSAHIIFPALDSNKIPATLSKKILTDYLRIQLGYDGLIISDALDMKAISAKYTVKEACIKAIQAGVDLLCLSGHGDYQRQTEGYQAVVEAVKCGIIPEETIDISFKRIMKTKNKIGLLSTNHFSAISQESYKEHEEFAQTISKCSIIIQKNDLQLLPLQTNNILVISTPPVRANIADDSIVRIRSFAQIAHEKRGWDYKEVSVNPSTLEREDLLSKVNNYDVVIFATYNAITYQNQIILANALIEKKKEVVFVTLRVPYDILHIPQAKTYIHAYEYTNRSINNVLEIVSGDIGV